MIRKSAIKEFTDAARDSFVWMKKLPEAELDAMLAELRPKLRLGLPLNKQQKVGFLIAAVLAEFAFFYDLGAGKSLLALAIILRRWQLGKIDRALIMAKDDQPAREWEAEIKKWNIGIPYILLGNSTSAEKQSKLAEFDKGIIIATYPGLTAMLSRTRTEAERNKLKSKKKQNTRVPDKEKIASFGERLSICVWDESTRAANKESLTFKCLWPIAEQVESAYALAGRPVGRDPELVFGQMLLTDKGKSLGETLGVLRQAFFEEKLNYWGGFEYRLTSKGEARMARALEHRSLSYSPEECGFKVRCIKHNPSTDLAPIPMPAANKPYLDKTLDELFKASGKFRETTNAFMRLRQISSGFIGLIDDETGAKAALELPENPKLEWLLDKLDEIPLDCKWIVFHDFIHSGRKIDEALQRYKMGHVWMSGLSSKQNPALFEKFKTDKRTRGLLANKVAYYSINAQVANYQFFFESPVGVIDRKQAERRAWRTGQEKVVHMFDPCIAGTADESILAFHEEGDDLLSALVRNPQRALKLR